MANSGDLLIVATDKELTRDDLERADHSLRTNEPVRTSLDLIHLSSVDALLLRELWSPSYVKYFFSDFGIQTMDHPRLHYMAGKMFFMGATMPQGAILGPNPVPYLPDYLMTKRHSEWTNFRLELETFKSLLESTKQVPTGFDLPQAPAIKLKAYLYDPKKFSLTAPEKQRFMVDLIPLITGESKGEEAWTSVGFKGASYRTKAGALLSHIQQHRNWIVPYPIDGVKAHLAEGIRNEVDISEKNWCALNLVLLLTHERADQSQIKTVLARLERDPYGRVILKKEDEGLWSVTEMQLRKLPVQK
jgi:hypothetical protein